MERLLIGYKSIIFFHSPQRKQYFFSIFIEIVSLLFSKPYAKRTWGDGGIKYEYRNVRGSK